MGVSSLAEELIPLALDVGFLPSLTTAFLSTIAEA